MPSFPKVVRKKQVLLQKLCGRTVLKPLMSHAWRVSSRERGGMWLSPLKMVQNRTSLEQVVGSLWCVFLGWCPKGSLCALVHEPIYIQCINKSSLEKARRGSQLSHGELGEEEGWLRSLISQLTSYLTSMGLLEERPGVIWKKGQVSSLLGQIVMGS